jgi:hypothetical protein
MSDKEKLYITHMKIRDFMGIEFVEVDLGLGVTVVSGRNGQGKSSFLKAVPAVFGGEKNRPSMAVRRGQRRGSVEVKLSDLRTVLAKWNEEDKCRLVLLDKDGNEIKRAQEKLNGLISELTFDPLKFLDADKKRRVEIYRQLGGVDFTDHDAERDRIFNERREVNRAYEREKASANALPHYPDAPAKEVDFPELVAELNARHAKAKANDAVRQKARDTALAHQAQVKAHAKCQADVAKLREALRLALEAEEKALVTLQELFTISEDAAATCAKLEDPDVESIQAQIAQASGVNEKVRANANRKAAEERARDLEDEAQGLTDQLADLDAEKLAKLKAAQERMPVKNLSIDGDEILWCGRPLDQASGAEQVDFCVEVGAALNPGLNTILIDDAEKLNEERLERLAVKAAELQIQVIVAKATEGQDAPGIVIEAGKLKHAAVATGSDDFPEFE